MTIFFTNISLYLRNGYIVRWAHAAKPFLSIEFSFHPYNIKAWLPQGCPQGKQICGKNSKNINMRRYFKFNREANSIQTFICPMCTATLCNLCYIVVCCEFLVYVFWQKSCNTSTTLENSVAQFVSDSWASCFIPPLQNLRVHKNVG